MKAKNVTLIGLCTLLLSVIPVLAEAEEDFMSRHRALMEKKHSLEETLSEAQKQYETDEELAQLKQEVDAARKAADEHRKKERELMETLRKAEDAYNLKKMEITEADPANTNILAQIKAVDVEMKELQDAERRKMMERMKQERE